MGLQVIGAGFGRTGTTSLKTALEQIGFGPCHHMSEVMKNKTVQAPFFMDAASVLKDNPDKDVDWDLIYGATKPLLTSRRVCSRNNSWSSTPTPRLFSLYVNPRNGTIAR